MPRAGLVVAVMQSTRSFPCDCMPRSNECKFSINMPGRRQDLAGRTFGNFFLLDPLAVLVLGTALITCEKAVITVAWQHLHLFSRISRQVTCLLRHQNLLVDKQSVHSPQIFLLRHDYEANSNRALNPSDLEPGMLLVRGCCPLIMVTRRPCATQNHGMPDHR